MGKSPGKWIKAVIFGKKSSKSNSSKGKETTRSSIEKASPVSIKEPASKLAVEPFSVSESVPCPIPAAGNGPEFENEGSPRLPSIGMILSLPKQHGDAQTATGLDPPEDSERTRLEQAATKAQAVFRGHLARQEFRALDGITKLQAAIRAHLVRRQAVSTLQGVQGIVQLQALIRGQIVRCSNIGIQVPTKSTLKEKDAKHMELGETNTYNQSEKLLKNAFVTKLLSLSPTPLLVNLQYGPEEPDSAWNWLLRWTSIQIWEPQAEPKNIVGSKHGRVEKEQASAKRSTGRLQSGKVDNSSNPSTNESEKQKRNPRWISSHSTNSVLGHPQNEIGKLKHNLKKTSNSKRDTSIEKEVDTEKGGQNHGKGSTHHAPELSEHSTDAQSDKHQVDLEGDELKQTDQVKCAEPAATHDSKCAELLGTHDTINELFDRPIANYDEQRKMIGEENESILAVDKHFKDDLTGNDENKVSKRRASLPAKRDHQDAAVFSLTNSKDDKVGNESDKVSNRRASLPGKHDERDAGLPSETRVPSYMAATESAKAKVRGLVSPRFGQDAFEKNGLSRRYSLPSSTNAKLASSPRVQNLVQPSGKAGIKIDRSLSSSRDGKFIQAEWRR